MLINFTKMNALGNDYIFFNAFDDPNMVNLIIPHVSKLSNRHFGIGADGIIIIESSELYDCTMRIFNSDGSEGIMCGNGIRQLTKLLWDKNIIRKEKLKIETLSGVREVTLLINEKFQMEMAIVNMGGINFDPKTLPFYQKKRIYKNNIPIFYEEYQSSKLCFYVGSLGNAHATCILEDNINYFDFKIIGKKIETNKNIFPDGINVEFVNIISDTKLIIRVWEKGSGHTLACGTGATFVVGLGMKLGILDPTKEIEVILEKGSLFISKNNDQSFNMKGIAELVFEGTINI